MITNNISTTLLQLQLYSAQLDHACIRAEIKNAKVKAFKVQIESETISYYVLK